MYYLAYGFFYLISLLPFRVIYFLSDGVYFLVYHVIGYRKQMVTSHLIQTFPDMDTTERVKLIKKFYHNFCDLWFEMIKILSMSKNEAAKRMKCDFTLFEEYYKSGKSIQMLCGHFINWEYLSVCVPAFQSYKSLAIFLSVRNKAMDRLIFGIRSKFGGVMLRAGNMDKEMQAWNDQQYLIFVAADQSPSNMGSTYWANFCNRPTGFIKGPWIRAARQGQPYTYLQTRKTKRGYYEFKALPFEDDPSKSSPGDLALKYIRMVEADIKEAPELYLWTHNRWKRPWKPEYARKWVDTAPAPTLVN